MHRSLPLAALAFTAGCGALPSYDSPLLDLSTFDPLAALGAETGHPWTARYRSDLHTPALVEGRTAPLAATGDDALRAGRQFLKRHRALFSMAADDDLDPIDGDSDELGMSHAHLQELAQGHPVWGGELVMHFASDGALVRINGRYIPITAPLPTASLDADAARVAAVNAARAANPMLGADAFTSSPPRLYVYPLAPPRLAWRVQVDVASALPQALETFIDAADGKVLHAVDTIPFLDGKGVGVSGDVQPLAITQHGASYWLEDPTRGSPAQRTSSAAGADALPGNVVRSKDASHWDEIAPGAGAAVDAHAFVAATWDHFASVLGRAGWDDSGKGVKATVHFGDGLARAFFDGKQLVFGDGDGKSLLPPAGGRDVVAHEFTHGVVAHTAHLGVEGQPGALHEALADIFACFVDGNWQIGETIARPGPLRDIAVPGATGNAAQLSDANGDVHHDSTIVSRAAWLMTQSLDPVTVEKIWYRALTRYLWSSADFADAADATVSAARDLVPDGAAAVRNAWIAVGVVSK